MASLSKDISLSQYVEIMEKAFAMGKRANLDIIGSSMAPTLVEGDSVVLDMPDKLRKNDIILYHAGENTFNLHRIKKLGDTLKVLGDNNIIMENVPRDAVVAKVVEIHRNGKVVGAITRSYYVTYSAIRRLIRRIRNKLRG